MNSEEADAARPAGLVQVLNREGRGRVVIACDHASNRLLPEHGTLGLDAGAFERHIAWDPGALPVSLHLSKLLDAPVVAGGLSRLVIDCNRPFDAPDLIPEVSETTVIPGNAGLGQEARRRRIEVAHKPFHDAIDGILSWRLRQGMETWLISIHSFTPVYKDIPRPWQIGILHDDDERLSRPMIEAFGRLDGIVVGDNQPYSPADRVYYTLERHARSRGLPCVMIEIRNDELLSAEGQAWWGDALGGVLSGVSLPMAGTPGRRMTRA